MIEWAVAARTLPGQASSGDCYFVRTLPQRAVVAVVDALGHGAEATQCANLAVASLEDHVGESLIPLVRHCHDVLRGSRGVVISLASFYAGDQTMTWLGVGNVAGILLRHDARTELRSESLLLRSGVVGGHLPTLAAAIMSVTRGDTLALATDGIAAGFADGLSVSEPPQIVADRILATHAKASDDALVLVARYLGGARD